MSAAGRSRAPGLRRSARERHGRGPRGPLAWPAVPAMRTRTERFDDIVRDVAEDLDRRLEARGLVVEYAAMDIPIDLGPAWSPEIPLARTVAATKTTPARIIAFRRPIETRARGQASLVSLVRAVLAAEVSSLFAIPPEELEDYGDDEY